MTISQFKPRADGRIGVRFPVIPETAPTPVTEFRKYRIENGDVVVTFCGRDFEVYEHVIGDFSYLRARELTN